MLSSSLAFEASSAGDGDSIPEDPTTKKKDMLVGKDTPAVNDINGGHFLVDNFSLTEQDIKKSVVDGIPSIDFSERVYKLLEKDMSTSMVLKMLG
ncbi:hypothetical protein J1N35_024995 [Gossypium stocksii]|uniref:Uncharacterized protein n=1 Tax=Gossypium stocksii TaxID=47602 RepID=A0A9D3V5R2_9ROSI|nr:hypothetical protein J1N35_024995 [Gossypium stocksii]